LTARRPADRSARGEAHAILVRIEAGRGHSNQLLADLPERLDARDRALATELVYGVLRRRAGLDRFLAAISTRDLRTLDLSVLTALRLGVYQLLHLDRVPRAAAVDESVRLVRARPGRAAAAFVNGVLRQACRRLDASPGWRPPPPDRAEAPAEHLAARHSFPVFLVARWLRRFGFDECEALLAALNRPAPVVLRPTRRSGGPAALAGRLAAEGVATAPSALLPGALRVLEGVPQRTGAFRDGWFYIQDEASQIVTDLLEPLAPEHRLLDVCAAPGGKILAVLDRLGSPGGLRVAADASPARLRLLRDNARRLRLEEPLLLAMDAARPALRGGFDRVLLDAPCSGTGIIRRHPEIRWRRREADIAAFAARQAAMLQAAAGLLAPGGRMVYAVCSLEPEEGPERIEALQRGPAGLRTVDARVLLPAGLVDLSGPDGFFRSLPHRHDADGFFAAVLERRG
jgi:16S rRNA (cytosine967-C5)-methyltransferase